MRVEWIKVELPRAESLLLLCNFVKTSCGLQERERKRREEEERRRLEEERRRQEEERRRQEEEQRRLEEERQRQEEERRRQEEERRRLEEERRQKEEFERRQQEEEERRRREDAERARLLREEQALQAQLAREERERQRAQQAKKEVEAMEETEDPTPGRKPGLMRTLTTRKLVRAFSVAGKPAPPASLVGMGPANLNPIIDEVDFNALPPNFGTMEELPPGALPLCRYKNILPNAHSRVQLDPVSVNGAIEANSDFINANWVRGWDGKPAYIATQVRGVG